MAQLKDLLVNGDAKFLADVILDHDPTANLHAATKQYVDAQVGTGTDEKVKITDVTSGSTYLPILALTTDSTNTTTRQADISAKALKYILTPGTSGGTSKGTAELILGNGTSEGYANSAAGRLTIYGNSYYSVTLKYQAVHTGQTLIIPAPTDTSQTNYLVSKIGSSAIGSTTQPVYVDSTGHVTVTDLSGTYAAKTHTHAYVPGSGANFRSGGKDNEEHNANNITESGSYYITSNAPATTLGAHTNDDSCWTQAYNSTWITQLAQDYRDGQIFVRSKNNNSWQSWKAVPMFTTTTGGVGSTTSPVYVDTDGCIKAVTSCTPSSHDHGNISWEGNLKDYLIPSAVLASGDGLLVFDADDNGFIYNSDIVFDTSITNQWLCRNGTWSAPSGLAPGAHTHGHINNDGTMSDASSGTVANGDKIAIVKSSGSLLSTSNIAFDGSTTTQFLSKAGSWQSVSSTDEKVQVSALTSGTSYYPILATGTGTATRQADTSNSGFIYKKVDGTTSSEGSSELQLGNALASNMVGNTAGIIKMYGATTFATSLRARPNTLANTIYLPMGQTTSDSVQLSTGYLIAASSLTGGLGSSIQPVYVDQYGYVQAGSYYGGGTKILLNGITDCGGVSTNIYAPISAPSSSSGYWVGWDSTNSLTTWKKLSPTINSDSGTSSVTTLAFGGRFVISVGGESCAFNMPGNPNTNYYHTTGSWNGLTYTAANVGSPGDLAFTIPTGTTSTTVAVGNHTHTTSISTSTATNQITLAYGSKYSISAGGTSYVFTMPSAVTSIYEANLAWGGKDFKASFGPLDAALIATLSPNRFAFPPAGCITIEYSTDAGATWTDYGATDAQKIALFGAPFLTQGFNLGKHTTAGSGTINDQLRITVDTYLNGQRIYSEIKKWVCYFTTNGAASCTWSCQVRTTQNVLAGNDTWANIFTDVGVDGWSGYNVANHATTIGSNKPTDTTNTQYRQFRIIFKQGTPNANYASASVSSIQGYGGVGWATPSNIAKHGNVYSVDAGQNVTFPGIVNAPKVFVNGGVSAYSDPLTVTTTGATNYIAKFQNNTTTAASTTWIYGTRIYAPNMVASPDITYANFTAFDIGVAASAYNSGNLVFHYSGAGSSSNFISMGLHSHNHILSIVGTERVGIMNRAPDYTLDVTGTIHASVGVKIGTSSEIKSIGTGLGVDANGALYATGGATGTVTGSGIGGYLAKWSGSGQSTELTVGPPIGSSTTTYLREDGTWATPPDTKVTQTNISSGTDLTTFRPLVMVKNSGQSTNVTDTVTYTSYASMNPAGELTVQRATTQTSFNYGANARTQYNSTLKAIEFIFS